MATAEKAPPTLAVAGLNAWYGESHILHGEPAAPASAAPEAKKK